MKVRDVESNALSLSKDNVTLLFRLPHPLYFLYVGKENVCCAPNEDRYLSPVIRVSGLFPNLVIDIKLT